MDLNENTIREEVNSLVSTLQRLLPKKKDLIFITKPKPRLTRLSEVHADAKNVFPNCFIGARTVVQREVMNRVRLVQQYNFGRTKESYKSFSDLLHKEMDTKGERDGVTVDTLGSATATYTEVMDDGYNVRLTSKIKDLIASELEIVFEKEYQNAVGSVASAMTDVDPKTLKVYGQYMYKIMPEFSVGTELTMMPLVYPPFADFSMSARYERASYSVSSTIGRGGFQMCLFKQFAPDLRVATIIHENNKGGPATFGVAMHKSYTNGTEVKMFVDSQRCGGFTVQRDVIFREQNEERVLRLVGSTLIDRQRRVRFGIGFNLDF